MKKILIITAVFILGAVAVMFYLSQKPVPSVNDLKTDFTVTATDLFAEYQANEGAANQKYNGKIVEVSGVIKETKNNEAGQPTVVLESGDPMFGVICELKEKGQATKFSNGQQVTLKGECTGYLMDVVLARCVEK
ncbi:MAG: hypothetical protein HY842_03365 [Bacteroidetes bacterium]|nr:hypothetical protein [Bacteroidota bacterium]